MQSLLLNVKLSFRTLRRSPGFALTAILTLALGIGAVTSVFSVVDGVLLKPFAFREPGQLIVMRELVQEMGSQPFPDNYRHYLRLKSATRTLEDASIFHQTAVSVSPDGDHPRIVDAVKASPNFFHVLGVQPMLGRDFVAADADRGAQSVAVLSYEGWQSLFQGDPKVIGQTLRMGGVPSTVIGVLPVGTRFPQIAEAPNMASAHQSLPWDPFVFQPMVPSDWDLRDDVQNYNFSAIARLNTGVTLTQARSELDGLQHAYSLTAHLPIHLGIALTPLANDVTSGISTALWLLFASVGGVLMIACVNLANLQLARTVAAERETAVRAALGASRTQLLMARLSESLVLAIVGGTAGIALAFLGVRLLVALAPANVPRLNQVQVSLPALLFAAGISLLTAILFGILPALRSLRTQPGTALQPSSSRMTDSRDGRRTRNLLVAAEVCCTVVLLIFTALVLRSFSHVLRQDRGFDSSHLTIGQVDLFAPQYGEALPNVKSAKIAFIDRALTALQQLPGVQSAAVTSAMPLTGETWMDKLARPDHPAPEAERPLVNIRWTSPSYLSTMHIPLVAGRDFKAADRNNPFVVLISEKTARDTFHEEDPIGRKIDSIIPDGDQPITVIGVVANNRINGLKDTSALAYMPYWAYAPWTLSFLVRSSQPSEVLIPEMRRVLWSIDPQVAIPTLKSMDEQVSESVAGDRFQAILLSSFGAAALLLALLGIHGVLAYSVSLRQQEFGIRIALGSGKGALMRLVVRQAASPVLFGAGAGLVMSFVALRWVRSLLFQPETVDPLAIGGSLLLLLAAAVLAALLPVQRAAAVDLMAALRNE